MKRKRVDNCVIAGSIGIGESVVVMTLMGNEVFRGDVVASTPFGINVRDSEGKADKFFREDVHLFVVNEPEQKHVVVKKLEDMTPDERVAHKLAMIESSDPSKKDTGDKGKGIGKKAGEEALKKEVPKNVSPKEDAKDSNGDEGIGKNTDVDVDKLPDDIKNAIISVDDLAGKRLNGVIGDMGDAAMKALRRAGVEEDGIYDIVSQIQNAIKVIINKGKEK